MRLETFVRAFVIRARQPRIPSDISGEDRGEAAGLAHVVSPAARRRPDGSSSRCSAYHDGADGAQPLDNLSGIVKPPHMRVAGREKAIRLRGAWMVLDREEQLWRRLRFSKVS